jgi:serine-type D-Ala-D-Ala carboxypeptidase/endopeptidase
VKEGKSKIITHRGKTPGFSTFIGFDPDLKIGVVVLANSAFSVSDIGLHLINNNIPLRPPNPVIKRTEIDVSTKVLEEYVGQYDVNSGSTIKITLQGGRLFCQNT